MSVLGITFQYITVLVAAIGLLVYLASSNPKAVEVGRLTFFAALFVLLLKVTGKL